MSIDIFIKSYNRVFYLDRSIRSIKNNVSGDYQITILDDGTPQKYLEKLKTIHPEIIIKTSENYAEKSHSVKENIRNGKNIDGFFIPTKLWYNAAENASPYFVMTEDDVWFTKKININELVKDSQQNKISLLKLGVLGNFNWDDWDSIFPITDKIEATKPKELFLSHPFLMDLFFYNRYKFFTILYKLGLYDNESKLKYWTLNSILMGLWKKEYWLFVWKDSQGKVDEKQQLRNAAIYYQKEKDNPNFSARMKEEVMRTTFQSSATNSYHEYGYDVDVNLFNHLLNEAWLQGKFDAMQNYPADFSVNYLASFISEKMNIDEYRKWVKQFKNQYRNLGCSVD